MRQYKIEIICEEDYVDKGLEILEYIDDILRKEYCRDEYVMLGHYINDDEENEK